MIKKNTNLINNTNNMSKKITQQKLVMDYIKEYGSLTPARMGGKTYKNTMFGSELPRTCRRMRSDGILDDGKDGKFVKFFFKQGQQPMF